MKVVALLLCALLISSTSATVYTINTVTALVCTVLPVFCNLENYLIDPTGASGTPGVNDDIDITTAFASAFSISTNLNVQSISVSGAAGSILAIPEGLVVNIANAITVAAGNVVNTTGTLATKGLVSVGSAAAFIVNSASSVSFTGGINVDAGASGANQGLVVNGGGSVTISADSVISGALTLAPNSLFAVQSGVVTLGQDLEAAGNTTVISTLKIASSTAQYTQSQGNLILSTASSAGSAVINATNVIIAAAAALRGSGTINGNVNVQTNAGVGGTVAPGFSPGTVYINGDYDLSGSSTYELEIASSSSFDRVVVEGATSVNGFLHIVLDNNYQPQPGDNFQFITSVGTVSGKFTTVYGDSISNLAKYSQSEGSHTVTITYSSASSVGASVFLLVSALVFAML